MTDTQKDQWIIVSPGRLELAGTHYAITWSGVGPFVPWWGENRIGSGSTHDLDMAKWVVGDHIKSMIQMGYEV